MQMKLNKSTVKLICDIEHIIGSNCWNDNAAYGYGDYIRYPVWAKIAANKTNPYTNTLEKTETWEKFPYINLNNLARSLTTKEVKTLEYRFGANELQVGVAIVEILEYLENRYSIDFAELEKGLKKK